VDIGTAQLPAEGETVCGDAFRIIQRDKRYLFVVVDGLGHGPHAATAANAFCEYVETHPDEQLDMMLHGADRAVSSTRGAAAMIARVDVRTATIDIAGVGNVAMRAWSKERFQPLPMRGVLGRGIRNVRVFRYNVAPGDLFSLYSDGISANFDIDTIKHQSATNIAQYILAGHRKSHDDATCVVARYLGA
jgi:serine phosphatase RsbU (regulator of sigma subunit)